MNNLNLIVKIKFGSHLYGTNNEDSDLDYKGVFLPTKEEVLLAKVPKSHSFTTKGKSGEGIKNMPDDIDTEIYSLHYFLKLALEGQTVALDMLHAPDNMIESNSYIWNHIISSREKFYTKNLKAFVGYARRQASKYGIKGSRLNDAKRVIDFLEQAYNKGICNLNAIWDQLPKGEHMHLIEPDRQGIVFYQVCGKKMQRTLRIDYALGIITKFYEEYGKRAQLAAENKGIDWKAVSHAIRAAYQIKEILTENNITFPLKEADFIRKVKGGELDYNTIVAPKLEELMEEVEVLSDRSDLPIKPDYRFWDEFLMATLERELFSDDI